MLWALLKLVLRLVAVAAVTAAAGVLADRFGAGHGQAAAIVLALFGASAFFFAPYLEGVIWQSHGLRARASPAVAFRILAIVVCILAALCLFFWRD